MGLTASVSRGQGSLLNTLAAGRLELGGKHVRVLEQTMQKCDREKPKMLAFSQVCSLVQPSLLSQKAPLKTL